MSTPNDVTLPDDRNPYLESLEELRRRRTEGNILTRNLADFKTFILRGNLVDLAVGIVLGVAFGSVVAALVKDLITPVIAAFGGAPDFSALRFTIHNSTFAIGEFINALISFLILATVVFFFVIKPVNTLIMMTTRRELVQEERTMRECPQCLSEIPRQAHRCRYCTVEVEPEAVA